MSPVHKKYNELVHLLKSGGERGVKRVKVNEVERKKRGKRSGEREKGE